MITECTLTGKICFLKLCLDNGTLVFYELNENKSYKKDDPDDRVTKIISIIFKSELDESYRQCGLALRQSGSLDYFWNYRIIDTFTAWKT